MKSKYTSDTIERLVNKYLQLFRTGNAVMGIIGVTVASFMAAGLDIGDHWQNLLISAAVVFMFICGGNGLNDYIDHEIDRTAHPERPIPSGRMTRETARNVSLAMMVCAVLASFLTMDAVCIAIVIVAIILMIAYEVALKQRGFIGNLTIAILTGMMFLLGGAVIGDVEANVIVALMAIMVSIGREIAKDIEDMESDEGDRFTLPMKIGVRNASILSCIFFIAGPVLAIQPMIVGTYGPLYYTVIIALVIFVYCAAIVFKDPHKAQKAAKKAMVFALLAFILGVFQF